MIASGSGNPVETEEAFYAAVYRRLVGMMTALVAAGTGAAFIIFHPSMALAFLAGGIIAILNFHWLKHTIEAMGGRLPSRERGAWGVVLRFLLRYALIAAAAYVILKSTTNSLYGFFAGLTVPAGAILAVDDVNLPSGATLIGDGAQLSTIRRIAFSRNGSGVLHCSGCSNLTISELAIDGNKANEIVASAVIYFT